MAETVISLAAPAARDPSVAGSKGATLATLAAHAFRVPEGVVVTTETYRHVVDDPDVRAALDALTAAVAAGDADDRQLAAVTLRDRLRERRLPASATAALADLAPGAYAVRSSATAEDLPGASFAGQYETHLGVDADDVPGAVRDCLASLFTDRAVDYRARAGVPQADVEMAVVVQAMVEPAVSGVLFTADPISGSRSTTVVEAGRGRGDAQVSGTTTADTVRYDATADAVTEYRVGGDRERVLEDRDVRALARIGDRLERLLGAPQDVEWAFRDGDVFVLQARPITGLYPLPEPRPTDGRTHVYYSFGHRQGMTAALTPLVADSWRELTNRIGREYGLPGRLAVVAGDRVFLDLTSYVAWPPLRARIVDNVRVLDAPAGEALAALLDRRADDFPTVTGSPTLVLRGARAVPKVWRLLGPAVTGLPRAFRTVDPETTPPALRETYDAAVERVLDRVRVGHTIADRVRTAYDELDSAAEWLVEPFYGPFIAAYLAGRVLRRWFPDHGADVDALALANPGDPVYRMTTRLLDLADVARETPAVADAIRDGATRAALVDVDGSGAFRAALDAFLDDYGFRAVGEIDWSRPRYREDPSAVLGAIATHLASDVDAQRDRHRALRARAATAESRLVAAATPPMRPVVRRLAAVHRGGLAIRELPKFALSRVLDELRSQTLAAGRALADAGALEAPEDVWLLSREELIASLEDSRTLTGLALAERRREHGQATALAAPRVLTSDGEVGYAPVQGGGASDTLRGTGAAPGVVEGVVRVVVDPHAERLEPGEVLVAPYTDPGWTPLFATASAVVTEVGGRLTHGSLVAREYGIPAVVAVPGATTRLTTGERVRVDGTTGVVVRVADGESDADAARDGVDEPTREPTP